MCRLIDVDMLTEKVDGKKWNKGKKSFDFFRKEGARMRVMSTIKQLPYHIMYRNSETVIVHIKE